MSLVSIFVGALLTENIVLTKFLGVCPFMGTSNKEKSAIGMGLATAFVIVISSIITYGLYHLILLPTETTYLMTIMFILVIASITQISQIIIKKYFNHLYNLLGIYLPLIATNCAVLGITLLNINMNYTFIQMLIYSVGSSLGFTLIIYIFTSIRSHLKGVPEPFKDYSIAFIIAAIMALIFGRFGL